MISLLRACLLGLAWLPLALGAEPPSAPAASSALPAPASDLVYLAGGVLRHPGAPADRPPAPVAPFYIGRYEVTQRQWIEVMGDNPSHFRGDDLPVESVSWYDAVEYCNRRSLREGLRPAYTIDSSRADPLNQSEHDEVKWIVTLNPGADGYRLPTEAEWEFAAAGGALSRGTRYSGADDPDLVAWTWLNAGDEPLGGAWNWPAVERNRNRTQPVGRKAPNELGLHDFSGNVREWCWDWADPVLLPQRPPLQPQVGGTQRVWQGGGGLGAEFCAEIFFRAGFEASGRGYDHGFRVCRSP